MPPLAFDVAILDVNLDGVFPVADPLAKHGCRSYSAPAMARAIRPVLPRPALQNPSQSE